MCRYVTLLAVFASSLAVGQEDNLRQRFEFEAPFAWNQYIALASHVQGEVTAKEVDLTTGKTRGIVKNAIKINGSMALSIVERAGEPLRLSCDNCDYNFVAFKRPAAEWSLGQLLWKDRSFKSIDASALTSPDEETLGSLYWQHAIAIPCRGLIIQATWLPRMFSSQSFKVTDIANADYDGEKLVRIDFEYNPKITRNNPVRNGYVLLDPSRYWLIKKAEVKGYESNPDIRFTILEENEFDDSTFEFPFVTRQIHRTFSPPILDVETIRVTKLMKMDGTDVAPFRLPAYGIPEPTNPSR